MKVVSRAKRQQYDADDNVEAVARILFAARNAPTFRNDLDAMFYCMNADGADAYVGEFARWVIAGNAEERRFARRMQKYFEAEKQR